MVGVGEGFPCGEDVGSVRWSWRTARLGSRLPWGVLCRLSLFLLGMERMIWESQGQWWHRRTDANSAWLADSHSARNDELFRPVRIENFLTVRLKQAEIPKALSPGHRPGYKCIIFVWGLMRHRTKWFRYWFYQAWRIYGSFGKQSQFGFHSWNLLFENAIKNSRQEKFYEFLIAFFYRTLTAYYI